MVPEEARETKDRKDVRPVDMFRGLQVDLVFTNASGVVDLLGSEVVLKGRHFHACSNLSLSEHGEAFDVEFRTQVGQRLGAKTRQSKLL